MGVSYSLALLEVKNKFPILGDTCYLLGALSLCDPFIGEKLPELATGGLGECAIYSLILYSSISPGSWSTNESFGFDCIFLPI